MKTGAVVVFVLAALATLSAIRNVFLGGSGRVIQPDQLVAYGVGAFLVPVGLLILGVWMWGKGQRGRDL